MPNERQNALRLTLATEWRNNVPNDQEVKPSTKLAPVVDNGEFSQLMDSDRFAQIQRVGKLYSESDFVTDAFRGKVANCVVALQTALRLQIDPVLFMQKCYLVHGKPGMEAQLVIALINARGPFTGPLQWKMEGEGSGRSCTCYATHKITGELCKTTIDWRTVQAEGWDAKSGSKWKTMPEQMFRYRSASWFGRLYCPEVLLGFPTTDELDDIGSRHEHVVAGDRVDEIPLPTARAEPAPQKPPETAENGAQASATEAPATIIGEQTKPTASRVDFGAGELFIVDKATGEKSPVGFGHLEGVTVEIEERRPIAELEAQIAADPMQGKRLASKAQRDMIIAVATKHGGMTEAQLNELLADKFSFTLATLPTSMVNEALQFLTKRNA